LAGEGDSDRCPRCFGKVFQVSAIFNSVQPYWQGRGTETGAPGASARSSMYQLFLTVYNQFGQGGDSDRCSRCFGKVFQVSAIFNSVQPYWLGRGTGTDALDANARSSRYELFLTVYNLKNRGEGGQRHRCPR
jgi:hypothetical protein